LAITETCRPETTNSRPNFTFLRELKLAIHPRPTAEDEEAIKLLRRVVDEFSPGTPIDIIHWTYESEEFPLPWLRASNSVFYGLDRIRLLAEQERQRRS
jgi:hypothetical protein